jgi:hypothetical protein
MIARTMLSVLCVGALAPLAWAQDTGGDESYIGVVTADDVYVRVHPTTRATTVATKLERGTRVGVRGKTGDWLKIEPPKGSFCAVSKRYVDVDPETMIGTVTVSAGGKLNVRSAGTLKKRTLDHIQRIQLERNDRVKVVSSTAEYYFIEPPEGAVYWISKRFVVPLATWRRMEAARLAREGRTPDSSPTPRRDEPRDGNDLVVPDADAGEDPNDRVVRTPDDRRKVTVAVLAWKAAEEALMTEFAKPFEQRNLPRLIEKYREIPLPENSYLKPYVEARISWIRSVMDMERELESIREMTRKTLDQQQRQRMMREKLEVAVPTDEPVAGFAAEGVLIKSDVFTGDGLGPRRYLLIGERGKELRAYVQSSFGLIDLDRFVNRYVGVIGPRKSDPRLKGTTLIEVEQIRQIPRTFILPDRGKAKVLAAPEPPAPAPSESPVESPEESPDAAGASRDRPNFRSRVSAGEGDPNAPGSSGSPIIDEPADSDVDEGDFE